ncbi:flavin reductase family protein [Streptomyces olivaceus]|uniref:flavin reductase family protein n=1 Tax=Streptomyces olivaceus TaxID=47716 RepID=UPI0036E4CB88
MSTAAPVGVDRESFRRAIGCLATGVTVITTVFEGRPVGMTASAVSSLSLDPVMLLACVSRRLPTHAALDASRRFTVNVLADDQEWLARRFATPMEDKFAGVELVAGHELPVLADAVAHFTCHVEERLPGGDHSIFTGRVTECESRGAERDPLLYFRGRFGAWEDGVRRA